MFAGVISHWMSGKGEVKIFDRVLKLQQAKELSSSIVATCDGCNGLLALEVSPRDMVLAEKPGIEQRLYLTAIDKNGNEIKCCKKPMRIVVENDGKLGLECLYCGKFKPIAVKDGKVVVE